MTIDKIRNNVPREVLDTIDTITKDGRKDILQDWLKACNQEIERRDSLKENTYRLHCEKQYLLLSIG